MCRQDYATEKRTVKRPAPARVSHVAPLPRYSYAALPHGTTTTQQSRSTEPHLRGVARRAGARVHVRGAVLRAVAVALNAAKEDVARVAAVEPRAPVVVALGAIACRRWLVELGKVGSKSALPLAVHDGHGYHHE
jgi:hypothetical protein